MLIKNGTIIDGTGKERFKADIRVEGDKIKEIGTLKLKGKEVVINAKNQFVTPGFVDILNRSDVHFSIFSSPALYNFVKQGVTTIVGGGCGASLAPLAGVNALRSIQKWQNISQLNINWETTKEFLDEVARHNLSINFATLTGHSTLRRGIVGDSFDKLDLTSMKKMAHMLEQSLEEGSFGLSTGLAYSHAKVAPYDELDMLVKVLSKKGGLYATHLRDEGAYLTASVNEAISLSRANNVPAHIFHFKATGEDNWSEFRKALDMIRNFNEHETLASFDVYPYTSTATVLYLLLPDWVAHGGKNEVMKKLRNDQVRKKIIKELEGKSKYIEKIILAQASIDKTFIGKTMSDIAKNQNASVSEAFLNIILASEDHAIGFIPLISNKNLELAIASPFSIISSDSFGYKMKDRDRGYLLHPRSFGTFPRLLARYVREQNLLTWESAINKITAYPAERLNLHKRGKIEKGYFADLVIFDPETIRDKATIKNPFQHSDGVNYVFVNGGLVLKNGKFQKKRWGRVLRK